MREVNPTQVTPGPPREAVVIGQIAKIVPPAMGTNVAPAQPSPPRGGVGREHAVAAVATTRTPPVAVAGVVLHQVLVHASQAETLARPLARDPNPP